MTFDAFRALAVDVLADARADADAYRALADVRAADAAVADAAVAGAEYDARRYAALALRGLCAADAARFARMRADARRSRADALRVRATLAERTADVYAEHERAAWRDAVAAGYAERNARAEWQSAVQRAAVLQDVAREGRAASAARMPRPVAHPRPFTPAPLRDRDAERRDALTRAALAYADADAALARWEAAEHRGALRGLTLAAYAERDARALDVALRAVERAA